MQTGFARELRMLAGFAIQPLVAAAVGVVVSPVFARPHASYGSPFGLPGFVAASAAFAAFFVTIFAAAPVAIWRLRRGPLSFRQGAAWGSIVGCGSMLLLFAWILVFNLTKGLAYQLEFGRLMLAPMMGALFGGAGGAAFWLVAIRGTVNDRRA